MSPLEPTFWILIGVAFVASFLSAIAGGGGLITVPALLTAGIPPILAMGTNKLQSTVGTFSSAYRFYREGFVDVKVVLPAACYALLGSVLGVLLVRQLGNDLLADILPLLLIAVCLYFLVSPKLSDNNSGARVSQSSFDRFAGTGMGFYAGFFGPGSATFYVLGFVSLLGYNIRKATAHTKIIVLVGNGCSAAVFMLAGDVLWLLALGMAAAQFVGARLGSGLVIKKGVAIVRPILILTCLAMAVYLLVQ